MASHQSGGGVLLVVPPGLPPSAGNLVTAERLARGLAALGVAADVVPADRLPTGAAGFAAVHALHAVRSGVPALAFAQRHGLPLVVTLTGTDMEGRPGADAARVLRGAGAVVAFHEAARTALHASLPDLDAAVEVIPPGVALPPPLPRRRAEWGWSRRDVVFLLPAGLREVKDPGFALEPLARLRAEDDRIRLAVAGPVRDAADAAAFSHRIEGLDWVGYLGEVPHGRMAALYRAADVVLNTSRAEGLSNAVLEAMAAARAVLVSDIDGNRAAVRHRVDGILFSNARDFGAWARRLAADPPLRGRLGRAARRSAVRRFSPGAEAVAHADLYARVALAPTGGREALCPAGR